MALYSSEIFSWPGATAEGGDFLYEPSIVWGFWGRPLWGPLAAVQSRSVHHLIKTTCPLCAAPVCPVASVVFRFCLAQKKARH